MNFHTSIVKAENSNISIDLKNIYEQGKYFCLKNIWKKIYWKKQVTKFWLFSSQQFNFAIPATFTVAIFQLLCEKWPNTEFFLVLIFPHSDWIRRFIWETMDQKKLRISTLFTHWSKFEIQLILALTKN